MLVNLDQLIEAAEEITPHNPLYQITIRAFDNNGQVPMRVVSEIGGLPFALKVLGRVLPLGDKRVVEYNRRCERGAITPGGTHVLCSAWAVASAMCEHVTLTTKAKHGPLRAFKARNREIARQTRLFKELFCAGDEELLKGEGL